MWENVVNRSNLFRFSHVDLGKPNSDGNCTKDYIGIYDGTKDWSSLLHKFCGNGSEFVNKSIVSKSNELKIRFISDNHDGDNNGFNASYSVYQEPTGRIGVNLDDMPWQEFVSYNVLYVL